MDDKKFTDEEIMQSLELIATTTNCNDCKIRGAKWGSCNCSQITAKSALDLISRYKTENLELKLKVNELLAYKQEVTKNNIKNYEAYKSQKAEIEKLNMQLQELWNMASLYKAESERWEDYNKNLLTANTALSNEILEAKTEAYKEFAERLKGYRNGNYIFVSTALLDNLLKEMVGEKK
mgnify:CR=1 FL=1